MEQKGNPNRGYGFEGPTQIPPYVATTPTVVVVKYKLLEEFERRLKLVLETELLGRNKITASNTIAIPILLYVYIRSNTDLESANRRHQKEGVPD